MNVLQIRQKQIPAAPRLRALTFSARGAEGESEVSSCSPLVIIPRQEETSSDLEFTLSGAAWTSAGLTPRNPSCSWRCSTSHLNFLAALSLRPKYLTQDVERVHPFPENNPVSQFSTDELFSVMSLTVKKHGTNFCKGPGLPPATSDTEPASQEVNNQREHFGASPGASEQQRVGKFAEFHP